jgi:hypothetical protein
MQDSPNGANKILVAVEIPDRDADEDVLLARREHVSILSATILCARKKGRFR